jgi:hypothetical protein
LQHQGIEARHEVTLWIDGHNEGAHAEAWARPIVVELIAHLPLEVRWPTLIGLADGSITEEHARDLSNVAFAAMSIVARSECMCFRCLEWANGRDLAKLHDRGWR